MLAKTEAVALRIIPFSESSQVVTWLSPDQGKIATMVKGVQRPKSAFLGQVDLFQTCELIYYSRGHTDGLDIAKEYCPLVVRAGLRQDWRSCAAASFACDLASRLSVHGDRMEEAFRLLAETLDFLDTSTARPSVVFWFELHLLSTLGFAPRLTSCAICGRPAPKSGPAAFSARHSGLLCDGCHPTRREADTIELRADLLALLRSWSAMTSPRRAQTVVPTRDQAFDLIAVFDSLLQFALGISVASRRLAIEVIMASQGKVIS